MDITRIGRNPATDPQKARASQISVHNGTVYFAATPNRPFAGGALGRPSRRERSSRASTSASRSPVATSRGS